MAARVRPPLEDKEMNDMFIGTFTGMFYDKLFHTSLASFSDLILMGEKIENNIKQGRF